MKLGKLEKIPLLYLLFSLLASVVSEGSFSFSSSAGAGGATRVNVSATKFLGLSFMVKPSV